jgi:2-polyprenyl-3-methyl-5-hydroxy-6-metoxy-1,4-benzoquinol methylase
MGSDQETDRLTKLAAQADYSAGVSQIMIEYTFSIIQRHIRGTSLLEIGPAEGVMTQLLSKLPHGITVIEGARDFCEDLKYRFPEIEIVNELVENFRPTRKYDNIILGHVLEHVEDPVAVLSIIGDWLEPGGIIFAAVPNSHSLHRQAGVLMGMLKAENDLSETDVKVGHRRVYSFEEFNTDIISAGLQIFDSGGYWLKPISNGQIEDNWSNQLLTAYMALGEEYPDLAAEIYVVAGNAEY